MFALESGERDAARVGRAARVSTLVTALVGALVAAASPWAIPLLFGPAFAPAVPLVAILILASVLGNPGSVAGAALSARGRPGLRTLALAIGAAIYLPPMLLLIIWLGALGAALAMFIATIVPAYLVIYWLHKHYGVPLSEFYRFRAADFKAILRIVARFFATRRA
ncbi:polysaccharide biosynthesis C-terminal domain-containing protein [Mycolicibacterium iranicum]|uniref:polysaccharide biosynthesis C-terminal domain-containing protein n=1 Tax=Mycolicibacterium iranicum TaxID=912594 RepID=UPI00399049DA